MQTDTLSETASVRRLTVSINLRVICIRVWREMMTFDELQQVGSVEEKQDRSKDRTLRDSKVDPIIIILLSPIIIPCYHSQYAT